MQYGALSIDLLHWWLALPAGAKADPTRLTIADLAECHVDPLARAVRQHLKRKHGVESGIPVLLSTERPRCKLVPVEAVGPNPLDYQVDPAGLSHF